MPTDNIQRAIRRAAGDEGGANLEEVAYEGYGPGGSAVIVQAVTDNRNRTVSEIRNAFARAGGNLGESGSVAWQFEARGVITLGLNGKDPDDLQLVAIDAGAADGFILGFPVQAEGLQDFIAHVIPVLEARGRYQRELTGSTLRDHLGLPRKESRYAAGADVQADADRAAAA